MSHFELETGQFFPNDRFPENGRAQQYWLLPQIPPPYAEFLTGKEYVILF